jgi:hypothetical protein
MPHISEEGQRDGECGDEMLSIVNNQAGEDSGRRSNHMEN